MISYSFRLDEKKRKESDEKQRYLFKSWRRRSWTQMCAFAVLGRERIYLFGNGEGGHVQKRD